MLHEVHAGIRWSSTILIIMGHDNVQWDCITNRDIITDLLLECNKRGITLMEENFDGFRSGPAVCGNFEECKDFIKWLME
eukprot:482668-Ditylum_brightwellii.AAC.1